MRKLRSTYEDFVKRAVSKHGNKYDYSNSIFIGVRKKINILCRIHGIFLQRGDHHLNGRGCPLCNKIIFYNDVNLKNEIFDDKKGKFYIIKLYNENEVFFKVGITTRDLDKRFKEFINCYNIELLHSQEGNLKTMYRHEKDFLRIFRYFKYKPIKQFNGDSECFSINPFNHMMYESN